MSDPTLAGCGLALRRGIETAFMVISAGTVATSATADATSMPGSPGGTTTMDT